MKELSSTFRSDIDGVHASGPLNKCTQKTDEPMTWNRVVLIVGIGTPTAVCGIVTNCLLLYLLLFRQQKYRSSPMLYMGVMAILDVLICASYILLFSLDAIALYWRIESVWRFYYSIVMPLLMLSRIVQFASVYMVLCATFERFFMVFEINRYPLPLFRSPGGRVKVIAAVLVVSTLLRFSSIFDYGFTVTVNGCEAFQSLKSEPGWLLTHDTFKYYYGTVYNIYFIQVVQVFIPFVMLCVLNVLIVTRMRQQVNHLNHDPSHHQESTTTETTTKEDIDENDGEPSSSQNGPRDEMDENSSGRLEDENDGCFYRHTIVEMADENDKDTAAVRTALITPNTTESTIESHKKKLKSATYTLVAIVSSYIICNSLDVGIKFLEKVDGSMLHTANNESTTFYTISTDIISFNFMFNSFIRLFIFMTCNAELRKDFQQVFLRRKRRRWDHQPLIVWLQGKLYRSRLFVQDLNNPTGPAAHHQENIDEEEINWESEELRNWTTPGQSFRNGEAERKNFTAEGEIDRLNQIGHSAHCDRLI